MPCYTAAVSARSAPESRKSVAILARRLSAYLIDWFISVLAGTALLSIVAVVLLVTSDLNRRDAPDWSIDAALALMSLWLPCWFLYASLAWGLRCKTIGMSLAGIRVTTWAGLKPGVWRAFCRALLMALFSAPILLAPLAVALAFSLGTTGPIALVLPLALAILVSAAALLSPAFSLDGRAWHDRISGTCVQEVKSDAAR